MAAGDLDAAVALLHPDVTFAGDSSDNARTAVRVIHGVDTDSHGPAHPRRPLLATTWPEQHKPTQRNVARSRVKTAGVR
jgi:hypothetical protein